MTMEAEPTTKPHRKRKHRSVTKDHANGEAGASHCRRLAIREKFDSRDLAESQPLTPWEHRERMRAEAEASRLHIQKLRREWEEHEKSANRSRSLQRKESSCAVAQTVPPVLQS